MIPWHVSTTKSCTPFIHVITQELLDPKIKLIIVIYTQVFTIPEYNTENGLRFLKTLIMFKHEQEQI